MKKFLVVIAAMFAFAAFVPSTALAHHGSNASATSWWWTNVTNGQGNPPASDFSCPEWHAIKKCLAEWMVANQFGNYGHAVRSGTAYWMNRYWSPWAPVVQDITTWAGTSHSYPVGDGSVVAWVNVKHNYARRYCLWGARVYGSNAHMYIVDQLTLSGCAEY